MVRNVAKAWTMAALCSGFLYAQTGGVGGASFLWTGAREEYGDLLNRIEAQIPLAFGSASLEKPSKKFQNGDFMLRFIFLDKRPSESKVADALTMTGWEISHPANGARLVYGALDVSGLPSRVRNISQHGAPYVSAHNKFSFALKTAVSASAYNSLAAFLQSPVFSPPPWNKRSLQIYTSSIISEEARRAEFILGADSSLGKDKTLHTDLYYLDQRLEERAAGGWFSEKPPLPERNAQIYGGSVYYLSPAWSIAGDAALSETFAYGRGLYWNLGLQLGSRPLRFSAAADSLSAKFTDSAGSMPDQGFRLGVKAEWFRTRGEQLRAETFLRGYGPGETGFSRSTSKIYYYFPTVKGQVIAPRRVSLAASRDARSAKKILESWDLNFSLSTWSVRWAAAFSLDTYTQDDAPSPFPDPSCVYVIDAWKVSAEAAWNIGAFSFTAKAGIDEKLDALSAQWKEPLIPFSLSTQFRAAGSRITLKLASASFPKDWTWAVSWRLAHSF